MIYSESDLHLFKLMHLLCIKAGTIEQDNPYLDYWVGVSKLDSTIHYCMLCFDHIKEPLINHAKAHLKEHNLLPFI